jgi:opacity protein-like surface antigen
MKHLILTITTLGLLFGTGLQAQDKAGFYVGARVFHADTDIDLNNSIVSQVNEGSLAIAAEDVSEDSKAPGVGLVYGYSFSEFHAIELQISYFKAFESSATVGITDGFNVLYLQGSSQLEAFPIMLSYLGSIPVHENFGFNIGAGAGALVSKFKGSGRASIDGVTSFPYSSSETEVTYAYQAQVGAYYEINKNLQINANFKYFKSGNLEFGDNNGSNNITDIKIDSKIIEAGIDYKF